MIADHVDWSGIREEREEYTLLTSESWHLQVLHLTQGDHESEFLVTDIKLEQRSTSYDLQIRQDDPFNVNMGNQDVTGDLANVLQKVKVQILVLQPCQLQVPIHICTICITIAKILIVVFAIRRNGHAAICTDAYCCW